MALDLSKPLAIHAEMARRGLLRTQLLPYEDPERGYVNPMKERETQGLILDFLDQLEMACRRQGGDR